ncbi:putative lipid-transfer protein DIR1 [Cicer arietinum]|uniref:Lipid-transfer protein DIR1 n=2 Tax=Cicer arietinum TaxID=3827 RepID=A0A1S2Z2X9_CICAR|nr:putative lipid-transfer protein DIR1 [Cicer arietinum]
MASTTRSLIFATLMITACILMLGISAQFECGGDLIGMLHECKGTARKDGPSTPPSEVCCGALSGFDASCLCNYVTSDIVDRVLDMDKTINLFRTCDSKNIPNDKCGPYDIPEAAPAKA